MTATEDLKRMAKIFGALSNEHRLHVYEVLFSEKLVSCCDRIHADERGIAQTDVVKLLGLAQSTISHHLGLLEEAGLLTTERRGAWTCYWPSLKQARRLAAFFTGLAQSCPQPDQEVKL